MTFSKLSITALEVDCTKTITVAQTGSVENELCNLSCYLIVRWTYFVTFCRMRNLSHEKNDPLFTKIFHCYSINSHEVTIVVLIVCLLVYFFYTVDHRN